MRFCCSQTRERSKKGEDLGLPAPPKSPSTIGLTPPLAGPQGVLGVVAPKSVPLPQGHLQIHESHKLSCKPSWSGLSILQGAKGEEPSGLAEDWPIAGTSTVTCRPQVWVHASLTGVNKGPFQGREPHFMLMQVKALGFCPLLGLDPVSPCAHQPAMCCPHGTL